MPPIVYLPATAAGIPHGWSHDRHTSQGQAEGSEEIGEGEWSEAGNGRQAAERGDAVTVHADRRLRVPLELPHGGPGGARRRDRLALRAVVRLPERVRHAARP